MDGETCKQVGNQVETWSTGDAECDAYSVRYDCGGVYHHNYMDVVGNRDHDCFWNCKDCNKGFVHAD